MIQPRAAIQGFLGWRILGVRAVQASRKVLFGFSDARTLEGITAHVREVYETYYREIGNQKPAERRLEYRLEDRWPPLCAFLGVLVEVPRGIEFPRGNSTVDYDEEVVARVRQLCVSLIRVAVPYIMGFVAITASSVWLR